MEKKGGKNVLRIFIDAAGGANRADRSLRLIYWPALTVGKGPPRSSGFSREFVFMRAGAEKKGERDIGARSRGDEKPARYINEKHLMSVFWWLVPHSGKIRGTRRLPGKVLSVSPVRADSPVAVLFSTERIEICPADFTDASFCR